MDSILYDGVAYQGAALKSLTYNKVESLAAAALHVNTLTATVDTTRARVPAHFVTADGYQLVTSDGYAFESAERVGEIQGVAQNKPLRYLRDGSQVALAYVKEILTVGPGRFQLTAISSVGLLTQMRHRGGI